MSVEAQREMATRRREAAVEDARRGSATVCNRVGYAVICGLNQLQEERS